MSERIQALILAAKEAFERMTHADREEMFRQQAESWARSCVRGDMTGEEWARWE